MNWAETIPFAAIVFVVLLLVVLLRLRRLPDDRRRRSSRIAWIVIVLILLAGIAIVPHSRYWILGTIRGEKEVDGHHISFWRYQIRNGRDYDRALAYGALHKLGPEAKPAVPELIDRLKDSSWQQNNHERTNPVAWVLARIGPGAREAIPALAESLAFERNSNHLQCADALVAIGPDSIPAMIPKLHHPNLPVRTDAAYVLGKFGNQAKDAVPELMKLIADPAMRALSAEFGKKETFVWIAAVEALGNIGPEAKDAIPIIVASLLERPSQPFGNEVWTALAKIDVRNGETVSACGQAATTDGISFETATRVFGALGARDAHVRELAAALLTRELETNWSSILVWRSVTPQHASAVQDIFATAMSDPSENISQSAAALYVVTLFTTIQQKDEAAFKKSDLEKARRLLEKAITPAQANVRIRARAVGALSKNRCLPGRPEFDKEPYLELRKTVPALIHAVGDSDAKVRHMAVIALAGRGVAADSHDELIQALIRYLAMPGEFTMDWPFMQDTVISHLGQLAVQCAEKSRPLAPALAKKLEESPHLSRSILETLQKLGPIAQDALPTLHQLAAKDPRAGIHPVIRAIEGKK